MKKRPIGIFDSGVGGLTVLREIEKLLPAEDIVYFGDTARVPYGNKSKPTIIKFSTENILFLLEKKVKIVVVACNTSSALALNYLKDIFSIHLVGVVEAGARKALEVSKNKKIGIIGTRSTVSSKSYEEEILKRNNKVEVYSKSCPLFVPLVEEGFLKGKITADIIEMYLQQLKDKNIDTLILGCTHYPLLKKEIAAYLRDTFIVDSAREVAIHTKSILEDNNLLNQTDKRGEKKFYVTDEPHQFMKLAKLFLKRDIDKPEVVNV
jgi:glutamate racemase